MTNKEIIEQLHIQYYELMKLETLINSIKYDTRLTIDKIKADATTTTNA